MKLYLHCGYHKTGSSFLQTLFSRNRSYLQKNGYYFPVTESEYDMNVGNISPGNGSELAGALRANNEQYANELMAAYLSDAKGRKCTSVLLSSENFFHAFENQQSLQLLTSVANVRGIESVQGLLYFRDPVSHALSTFKHRAKNGRISELSNWLETEYETMHLIERFMEYHTRYFIKWACRKYSSQSSHMAKSAFTDWLGVDTPAIPENDRVNTSLTLSELLVIRSLNKNRPAYIPFVRKAFAGLSLSEKASESKLKAKYNTIAYEKLNGYEELIKEVNQLLPKNEQLTLMSPAESVDDTNQETVELTKEQVAAFVTGIEAGTKSGQVLQKSKAILTKVVDKINRKIKTFTA